MFCESHASLVVGVVGRGLWVWFRRLLLSRDSLEEAVFPETGENIYSVPSHTHTHTQRCTDPDGDDEGGISSEDSHCLLV